MDYGLTYTRVIIGWKEKVLRNICPIDSPRQIGQIGDPMGKKVTLLVCRSCIRENKQADPCLIDEPTLRATYARKLKKGWFGKKAELRVVDCLTNCQNSNSAQINREDGEILFGKISSEVLVDEVIQLAVTLSDTQQPLAASDSLKQCFIHTRPHRQWRQGEDSVPADRVKL